MNTEGYRFRIDFTVPAEKWNGLKTDVLGFSFQSRAPMLLKHLGKSTEETIYAAFCTNDSSDFKDLFLIFSRHGGIFIHEVTEST